MMSHKAFTNELGNSITIIIEGPTSLSENTLTPLEAEMLEATLVRHNKLSPEQTREACATIAEAWIERGSPDIALLPTALRSMSIRIPTPAAQPLNDVTGEGGGSV